MIVASFTDPVGILSKLVPLVKGGGQVVVYAPHIEPLMEVCDAYSTGRRTAFLATKREREQRATSSADSGAVNGRNAEDEKCNDENEADGHGDINMDEDDREAERDSRFPVDPTLLLNPTIHHSHARSWQVLPGRTHPMMMGKGGAEGGYVLVSTRVIPVQGYVVQARGRSGRQKKRQTDEVGEEEHIAKKGRGEDVVDK